PPAVCLLHSSPSPHCHPSLPPRRSSDLTVPGQAAVSPMIYSILCEYEPQAQVMTTLHFNNIIAATGLHRYEWLIDGTEGSLAASDRKSTRLNSSHQIISYAVFCL